MGAMLIHTQSGGKAAAAHEGNAGQFCQPLDAAVFTVFSVKNRKKPVYGNKTCLTAENFAETVDAPVRAEEGGMAFFLLHMPSVIGNILNIPCVPEPPSVAGDTDSEHLITVPVDGGKNTVGGFQ